MALELKITRAYNNPKSVTNNTKAFKQSLQDAGIRIGGCRELRNEYLGRGCVQTRAIVNKADAPLFAEQFSIEFSREHHVSIYRELDDDGVARHVEIWEDDAKWNTGRTKRTPYTTATGVSLKGLPIMTRRYHVNPNTGRRSS
jgi:hypothetical protein